MSSIESFFLALFFEPFQRLQRKDGFFQRLTPQVYCDEPGYASLRAYAAVLVSWGVLFPSVLGAMLFFFARDGTLFKASADRFGLSVLFKPFKQSRYYWQVRPYVCVSRHSSRARSWFWSAARSCWL